MKSERTFSAVIFFFILSLVIPTVISSALAEQTVTEDGNTIIIENTHMKMVIGTNGLNRAFIDKQTNTNYLDTSEPVHFMTVRRGNVEYGSSAVTANGNNLHIVFGGSGFEVEARVHIYAEYVTVEILSINRMMLDQLILMDLPLTITERVAHDQIGAEHNRTINVCRNDRFGISMFSATLFTDCRTIRNKPAAFQASCYPEYGIVGAKAVIAAGPPEEILTIIGTAEVEQGLAHPTLGGVWGKISPNIKQSYLFVNYTEANIDRVIELAKAGGFSYIMNYRGVWSAADGRYEVNKNNFPNGLDGLKNVMDKIHRAGLKCGAHVLAGCISRNDAYVTPVPDPRLLKDDMRILAENIDAEATVIPITTSPEGLPTEDIYAKEPKGTSLVIDNEIIIYNGMKLDPPYALTGCVRGANGTQAASHVKGSKVYHLAQRWGRYIADANSSMLEEIAQRVADIINYCGFDMIYFDGLDGVEFTGDFFYHVGKLVKETCSRFNREVLVQGSNCPHFNWHNFSRLYTIDWSSVDPKGRVDYHCRERMANSKNNLMPSELGWFGYTTHSMSTESTTPDIVEYVLAKTVGWDVAWSLETHMNHLEHNGRTMEALELCKIYEGLRLQNYFSDYVKQKLRTLKHDFKLMKDDAGAWQMHPIRYGPHQYALLRQGGKSTLHVMNEYEEQSLKIRIKAVPAPVEYGDSDNIRLTDYSDLSQWDYEYADENFLLTMEQSDIDSKGGTPCVKLTARNNSNSKSSWTARLFELDTPKDISSHRIPGVWIYGDESNALLNIRLKDSRVNFRDFLIRLDFNGWKYFELFDPAKIELFDVDLPEYAMRSLRGFNYAHISSIRYFLTEVPPHTEVTCYVSSFEALKEHPTTLNNPVISVNGKTVRFPALLENYSYLEYWGGDEATVYDKNGYTISKINTRGAVPAVQQGKNIVKLSDSSAARPQAARVEVITIGETIPNN